MPIAYSSFDSNVTAEAVNLVRDVFTGVVLSRLRKLNHSALSKHDGTGRLLRRRAEILDWDRELSADYLRYTRAAWTTYLAHAAAVGVLDADLRERLTSPKDVQFWGALAECMVAWFFAARLGVPLHRLTAESGKKRADFEASGGAHVEVKAPHVPRPGTMWGGDDRETIEKCLRSAADQFDPGRVNVVVLAPLLKMPVLIERSQLVAALLGEWKMAVPIALTPGEKVPEPYSTFDQNGQLARFRFSANEPPKTYFTRVSAVAVLEEAIYPTSDGTFELQHWMTVLHNPFAPEPCRASPGLFGDYPQFLVSGPGEMSWTDGAAPFP